MNNKNAYEIRLDILKLAHDDLTGQYYQKIDVLRQNADKADTSFDASAITSLFPSTDEVIARAERLYKFVDAK